MIFDRFKEAAKPPERHSHEWVQTGETQYIQSEQFVNVDTEQLLIEVTEVAVVECTHCDRTRSGDVVDTQLYAIADLEPIEVDDATE